MSRDVLADFGAVFLSSRLKRLAERMQGEAATVLRNAGVPIQPGQMPLLAALDRYGPLTISEAVEALGVSQPAVTRTVTALVALDLVALTRDHKDQRQKTITLTAAGTALADHARVALWPQVGAAAVELCEGLAGPLLDQIATLERRLAEQPLDMRVAAMLARSAPPLVLREFTDDLAPLFHDINAEWIRTMFALEDTDRDVLQNPRERIITPGGAILFVEAPGVGIVGTCALQKTAERQFELTKMGVSAAARGRKAGEFLLTAMIARARNMGAETLYLLTSRKCAAAIHLYEKLGFEHDADIMARFGARYARCDVAMRYRGLL
ncbi:GNAT family N-acetyltransferase [Sphingomonas sp. BAUL-RG-20F-R05-02]|uniref:bifunctional helix-turn-helix transcriptional regulator/GNAT family N-acetyltransferase n=1 Tax=Sphingomonas sp. BAUL-RG-20F-R05-02 TaxID=2914830 RepID=UPI001F593D94|nr:GNAT family N-acetyltransferase [Sphingomonas sp. BAUL-RG-20F-R05-02]